MTNHYAESSPRKTNDLADMTVRLSTLWVFAMFNYLYADFLTIMDPATLKELTTGQVGSIRITQGFLLGAAILMETAIAMVLLARVLAYRANRLANIVIGAVHTAAVLLSMFVGGGTPAPYYILLGTIEVACTSLIVWYAWRWKPTALPDSPLLTATTSSEAEHFQTERDSHAWSQSDRALPIPTRCEDVRPFGGPGRAIAAVAAALLVCACHSQDPAPAPVIVRNPDYLVVRPIQREADAEHTIRVELPYSGAGYGFASSSALLDLNSIDLGAVAFSGGRTSIAGEATIWLPLTPEGHRRLETWPGRHAEEYLGIFLKGRLVSAPRIDARIGGGIPLRVASKREGDLVLEELRNGGETR